MGASIAFTLDGGSHILAHRPAKGQGPAKREGKPKHSERHGAGSPKGNKAKKEARKQKESSSIDYSVYDEPDLGGAQAATSSQLRDSAERSALLSHSAERKRNQKRDRARERASKRGL